MKRWIAIATWKYLTTILALAAILPLSGCSVVPMPEVAEVVRQGDRLDARIETLYVEPFDTSRIKQRLLRSLGSVQGDFRDQLRSAVIDSGMFPPVSDNALRLHAELIYWQDLNEYNPVSEMETTVRYTLSAEDGTKLFSEKITTTGESSGVFLVGGMLQSVRAANNSFKKNIETFVTRAQQKLPGILISHFEQGTPSKPPAQVAKAPATTKLPGTGVGASPRGLGNYHALVIGNNRYRSLPQLRTAVHDAEAIADTLKKSYSYDVQLLRNASRAEILRALSGYRSALGANDNLLIYYAGHGWLDSAADEGYWLPVDATTDDPTNWIANSAITSNLKAIKARHVMIIADSCYSGKLTRGIKIVQRDKGYFSRLVQKKSRTVLASGGLEPVEDAGGQKNHSVFTAEVLKALKNNRGTIDGTTLFEQIRRPVKLNADQTPEYADIRKAGHENGADFIFVRK